MVAGIRVMIAEGAQMGDEDEYVPRTGDMVIFDRPPPEGGRHRVFQVASHDAQTGMTTFARLPRALPAREMAELGARKVQVVAPSEVEPDWAGAGRRLAREGAGGRPKIQQLAGLGGYLRMAPADEQAALALAQRAADQTGEPVFLAQTGSGELIIGSHDALETAGEGLGTQTLLVVQPGLLGSGASITLRQARELLGSDRAREAVAAAIASAPELPASGGSAAAEAVLQAIAELLPPEQGTRLTIPGWQYREELMPEATQIAARTQADPGPLLLTATTGPVARCDRASPCYADAQAALAGFCCSLTARARPEARPEARLANRRDLPNTEATGKESIPVTSGYLEPDNVDQTRSPGRYWFR
jgi:hypothetical protein